MQYLARNNAHTQNNNFCGMTNSSNPVLKTDTDDQTTVMAHAGGDQMKISEMTEREAAFDQFQYKRR